MDHQRKQLEKEYQNLVMQMQPKSSLLKDCIKAFAVGGFICCIGQAISDLGKYYYGLNIEDSAMLTAIVLIFLGSTLTGIGIYDKIAKHAGAGSVVPITGFSNSIVAPAMEFKREGYIMGVGAKLFSIAGPVLVNGISASVIVGLIYYFFVL